MPRRIASILAALGCLGLLTGCQSSYPATAGQYATAMLNAGYADAAEIADSARESDKATRTLWTLKLASAQRAAGDLAASLRSLEQAESRFREADAKPVVALGREALSTFTDPYGLDYPGRNLDRIFAAAYQAIDHLQLGEPEKARVCLTRSLFRQEDARRRLAEVGRAAAEEAASLAGSDSEADRRLSDPALGSVREDVAARFAGHRAYADAMNPFAVWLNGVFYLRTADGPADLERARKSLQVAASLCPGNPSIAEDLALAEQAAHRPEPAAGRCVVYVVHEVGLAPAWSETVVTLPLIYADTRTPMVNVALPTISPQGESPGPTELGVGASRMTLAMLADVDAIVHAEFGQEYPRAVTRALASATIKATAGYIANRAAQREANSDGGNLLAAATLLATNAYGMSSAHADLRNWSSLPKEIRLAHLEVPRAASLRVTGGLISGELTCRLPPARAVLVTIRSISPGSPAILRTCILQP